MAEDPFSRYFIFRRLHSLTGFWLALYIIVHLLTNSQAALWLGDDGKGFIKSVNDIHALPFLTILEIILLGAPILIHTIWGIMYLRGARYNSFYRGESKPYLAYPRNKAYTWQRITSLILVVGLFAHIIHMRFFEYPVSVKVGSEHLYLVKVDFDEGLYTVADRLHSQIYDKERVQLQKEMMAKSNQSLINSPLLDRMLTSLYEVFQTAPTNEKQKALLAEQQAQYSKNFTAGLDSLPLRGGQVIVVTPDFGTAELFMLRETFKMPVMIALYTIFVLSACFHAFNGVWTFMISWGVTLTPSSQRLMRYFCTTLMIAVAALGLSTIWLTYWVNLKQ